MSVLQECITKREINGTEQKCISNVQQGKNSEEYGNMCI
jgi:hypothetical protein